MSGDIGFVAEDLAANQSVRCCEFRKGRGGAAGEGLIGQLQQRRRCNHRSGRSQESNSAAPSYKHLEPIRPGFSDQMFNKPVIKQPTRRLNPGGDLLTSGEDRFELVMIPPVLGGQDMTDGVLEENLESLRLREGSDYVHFS